MYSLFDMWSAQADAGSAQVSHQNEGHSGEGKEEEEEEEGLQKFGSEFTAETDSVYYVITIPC